MSLYSDHIQQFSSLFKEEQHLLNRVMLAKRFMDTHFSEILGLENLARTAQLSPFHFIRIFKKFYGKTPHKYLQERRIEAAKELLKANTNVSDTCFSVGFSSISSFSLLFKKSTGLSASSFQKRFSTAQNADHSQLQPLSQPALLRFPQKQLG